MTSSENKTGNKSWGCLSYKMDAWLAQGPRLHCKIFSKYISSRKPTETKAKSSQNAIPKKYYSERVREKVISWGVSKCSLGRHNDWSFTETGP